MTESEIKIKLKVSEGNSQGAGTSDYNELSNKPKLNGKTLIGDVSEIDPTVPDWAKEENKPTYTAEEIGALDQESEMSMADVKNLWDLVFND